VSGKAAHLQVPVSDLPPYVSRAVLAVEDKRFFQHGAFDLVGILRATWVDLRYGRLRQGASTISQQLARSIFLDIQRSWRRKILEAALATYLELRYTNPQLLAMYLNQVYWGQEGSQSLIGIEAVSQSLFGKPAHAQETVHDTTFLVSVHGPHLRDADRQLAVGMTAFVQYPRDPPAVGKVGNLLRRADILQKTPHFIGVFERQQRLDQPVFGFGSLRRGCFWHVRRLVL